MRIGFLQISDVHAINEETVKALVVKRMCDAIESKKRPDFLIMVFSGDIACSGMSEEYTFAERLIDFMKKEISRRLFSDDTSKIIVLLVPGNHDVSRYEEMTLQLLAKAKEGNAIHALALREKDRMEEFLDFSKKYNCFVGEDNFFCECKYLKIGGLNFRFNLVNSAIFSMPEEEKGYHYIPSADLVKLEESDKDTDITILIIHHPFEWYMSENKKEFEGIVNKNTDIVFWGHEHNQQNIQKKSSKSNNLFISQGGKFSNRGDYSDSEFCYLVYDVEENQACMYEFKHSVDEYKMIDSVCWQHIVPGRILLYDEAFFTDEKLHKPYDLRRMFVFPELTENHLNNKYSYVKGKRILDYDSFRQELDTAKNLIITGKPNSGKTYLLKNLLVHFLSEKNTYAVYSTVSDFTNGFNLERKIKKLFIEHYGNDFDFDLLARRTDSNSVDKILLFDDVDQLDSMLLSQLMSDLKGYFTKIVCTNTDSIALDIDNRQRFDTVFGDYFQLEIAEFYGQKRRELIQKVILYENTEHFLNDKRIHSVEESLVNLKNPLSNDPDFIVLYTSYVCRESGLLTQEMDDSGSIFSAVFESNVTAMLGEFVLNKNIDYYLKLLGLVAYYIHKNKLSIGLSQSELYRLVNDYNENYDISSSAKEFREKVLKTEILVENQLGNYNFRNLNLHSYFVAVDMVRRYSEEDAGVGSDVDYLLEYSCFEVNANILLFFTYLNRNPGMLVQITKKAEKLFDNWEEFSLSIGNIKYLGANNQKKLSLKVPSKCTVEQEQLRQEEKEREENKKKSNRGLAEHYEYSEEEVQKDFNQIRRAVSLLNVISKILPNFDYILRKEIKVDLVKNIYQFPNKIFYKWAVDIDDNYKDYVDEFKQILYPKTDADEEVEYTQDEELAAKRSIINLSTLLLLGLINFAVSGSTTSSTLTQLKRFDRKSSINYQLQYLMMLSKTKRFDDLYKESVQIYESTKLIFIQNMVVRIIADFVTRNPDLDRVVFDKFSSKFFTKEGKVQALIVRTTTKNKR